MTDSRSTLLFIPDIISIYSFVRVEVDFKIKSFFGRLMKSMARKML